MTIGTVNAAFPVGINFDLIDVGLLAVGTNGAESATSYTVSIGDEALTLSGTGFTFNGSGLPTGGGITAIQDQYQGQVSYELHGFSITVAQIQQWASVDDTASLMNSLFSGADSMTGGPQDDLMRAYSGNAPCSAAGATIHWTAAPATTRSTVDRGATC